jgi:ABC-type amino acid transport substrate-binding protein
VETIVAVQASSVAGTGSKYSGGQYGQQIFGLSARPACQPGGESRFGARLLAFKRRFAIALPSYFLCNHPAWVGFAVRRDPVTYEKWLRNESIGRGIAAAAPAVGDVFALITIMMQKLFHLAAPLLVLVSVAVMAPQCNAQESSVPELFELEIEYVYGRDRRTPMGYTKPEVFDPLNDRLYRAGYKNYSPIGVPQELKKVDAMTRVRTMKTIIACADGWFWPFSRTARKNEPPGLEIELLNTIAAKHGWAVEMMWVNMRTRFGPGAPGGAYDMGINANKCDMVLGLAISGDDHHMKPNRLEFTKPFMSTGSVLVTQRTAKGARSLDDIKRMNITIGLPAFSPISEYATKHGIPNETFFQNFRVIDALVERKIDAAMIWSGAISQAKLTRPEAEFEMVKNYVPLPDMRWNMAWVIKSREVEFKKFISEAFTDMLKTGEIKRIVERYGMPFYPPFKQ